MTKMPDHQREQQIRDRAYALWEEEGRPTGRHEQHWHDAAREIGDAPSTPAPKPRRAAAPRAVKKAAAPAETPAPPKSEAPAAGRPRAIKPKKA